jgi:tetratricopeptide (TPR) repeat protein
VWQELRRELHPHGLEIVTVALDTGGADAVTRWIARAQPEHPALIDQAHLLDELFGIVNVPSGVWIDEDGLIVRPPETAYPRRPEFSDRPIPADTTPEAAARIAEVRKLRIEADLYVAALRDWVNHGAASRYALAPDEVIARSRPRPVEEAEAAAHFALGQHLHRLGRPRDAVPHFQAALRLQPDNWTYKRQAWNLADKTPDLGKPYEGDWFSEVQKIGAENYYPKLDMEP